MRLARGRELACIIMVGAITRRGRLARAVLLAAALTFVTLPASASSFVLPTPGSSAEVSRLVAESVSRHVAPATLNPTVDLMGKDWYWNILPKAKCVDVVCSWGPTHPHRTIVLFGDSHAEMWAAAMEPAVVSAGDRFSLVAFPGCGPASMIQWVGKLDGTHSYSTSCGPWRRHAIAAIAALHPAAVFMAERTAGIWASPTQLMSDAQVDRGLELTVAALRPLKAIIGIVGDNPAFAWPEFSPSQCVATHRHNVSVCATAVRKTDAWRTHVSAERAVATREHLFFIDPVPWLCSATTCSPVIGNLLAYSDWSHVSATYAYYLSGVMNKALRPLL